MLLLFLACALPQFDNWIPFTVVIFYLISPIPTLIAKRRARVGDVHTACMRGREGPTGSSPCRELACFLTTGIVVSAFALPIVLSRATLTQTSAPMLPNGTSTPNPSEQSDTTVIDGGACGLVIAANSVMFLTILGFFLAFGSEDVEYSLW